MKAIIHAEVVQLFGTSHAPISAYLDRLSDDPGAVFETLNLASLRLVPGTQIIVQVPECPTCKRSAHEAVHSTCVCGHSFADAARAAFDSRTAEVRARAEKSDPESEKGNVSSESHSS